MKQSNQGKIPIERLLVINKIDQTLSVVDPEVGQELASFPFDGNTAHEVAASPDGRFAWIPIYGDSGVGKAGSDGRTINVIDIDSKILVNNIDLGFPSRPHCAIFGPNNGVLYLTSELTQSISVIDTKKGKVVDSIPTGEPESHMMVISNDGRKAYTSNVGHGTVSAIDIAQKKVEAVISISKRVQRIAISTDDKWVFTSDQIVPDLVKIDTRTNSIATRLPMKEIGFGMTPTRDGHYLLVTHPSANAVSVVDLQALTVQQIISVPPAPQEILVRPDNLFAYVSCDISKQVAVIHLSDWKVQGLIDVGRGADGLALAISRSQ